MTYVINKKTPESKINFNTEFDGFTFRPKNGLVYDGANINSLILVKPDYIDKVLRRKTKIKLESYLQYIIELTNDEDPDGEKIQMAYNDLTRYKSIIKKRYKKYLSERYLELLLKKIAILEYEIEKKRCFLAPSKEPIYEFEEIEEEVKSL
jgi:hypothetical protein